LWLVSRERNPGCVPFVVIPGVPFVALGF